MTTVFFPPLSLQCRRWVSVLSPAGFVYTLKCTSLVLALRFFLRGGGHSDCPRLSAADTHTHTFPVTLSSCQSCFCCVADVYPPAHADSRTLPLSISNHLVGRLWRALPMSQFTWPTWSSVAHCPSLSCTHTLTHTNAELRLSV